MSLATAAPRSLDGCTTLVEHPRRAFVAQIMGLPMSVHVRGPHARGPEVTRAVEAALAALRADDAMFSTWKANSAVSRIRRGRLRLEDAPPRVREVAALCEEASQRTGGSFSAWLPPSQAGADPRAGGGTDGDGTDSGLTFDPTGLVKGWAVEQAFTALMAELSALRAGLGTHLGAHDALLCAGGDVVVVCTRTDTPDWVVGVEDPLDRSRVLCAVPLRSGAVATSGTAARGAHILDPRTGLAPSGLLSATIVGPSLTWADVYATAAFVRGRTAADWVATLADHAAILVDTTGTIITHRSRAATNRRVPGDAGRR